MAHTKYLSVLAQAIYSKLLANKDSLQLENVYYGKQLMIPEMCAAVVLAGLKSTSLTGVAGPGGRVTRSMSVFIDIHRQAVLNTLNPDEGTEAYERLLVEQISEGVEDFLHTDTTMGGIIIHGFVNQSEPGDTPFQNGLFRSQRLTYVGLTKLNLA